jgi:SAM-dependent methyltransferase
MSNNLSNNQLQTEDTFGFKWKKRETYESPAVQAEWKRWLLEKYFDGDIQRLDDLLNSGGTRKEILDAGCGSGGSGFLLFGERLKEHDYLGVDISDAVLVAEERFKENGVPGRFIQSDLNSIPKEHGPFDVIFSEGVLHHTDSVEKAIEQLSSRLKIGGKFLFYVYAKKSPIREFTDDMIRSSISGLSNDEAWQAIMPLTKFGKILGDLNAEIEISEDIPLLGIKKGRQNLQRLFYYNVCKSYYRPDYSLEEMNHINFDWFRPLNCYRHTPEEIKVFCDQAGLIIERLNIEDAGISIIARK